jgi:hypothetical protein
VEEEEMKYRHGDLLVHKIERPDLRLVKQWTEGPAILLRGEATGHNHKLSGDFTLFRSNDKTEQGQSYFEVHSTAKLTHEEHDTIGLPQGFYAVVRQREYTPERIVYVRD